MGWGAPGSRGCELAGKPELGVNRGNDVEVSDVSEVGAKLLLGDEGGELLLGLTIAVCSFLSTGGFELSKESIQKELFSL